MFAKIVCDQIKKYQLFFSYRLEITNFTKSFLPWLDICMMNVPSNLVAAKMNGTSCNNTFSMLSLPLLEFLSIFNLMLAFRVKVS